MKRYENPMVKSIRFVWLSLGLGAEAFSKGHVINETKAVDHFSKSPTRLIEPYVYSGIKPILLLEHEKHKP